MATTGYGALCPASPSIKAGNTAIGYAVIQSFACSQAFVMPGVLPADPPNDLGQGEATMFTGTGSQTDTNGRWGDYSMTDHRPF